MMITDTYLLRITQQGPYRLYLINQAGQVLEEQSVDPDQLADLVIPEATRFVVALSGESVLFTTVSLPDLTAAERMKVLPYELEAQLIAPVETYHFASAARDPEHKTSVAVIERVYFESILEQLRAAALQPDLITPDFLLLPYQPYEARTWFVQVIGELLVVRTGQWAGFVADRHQHAAQMALQEWRPQCIKIMGGEAAITLEGAQDYTVETMDLRFDDSATLNLLQGPYQLRADRGFLPKLSARWKKSVYAFGAVLATLFMSQLGQYFYFQHQAHQLQATLSQRYQRLLVGAPVPVDRAEMSRQVNAFLQRISHVTASNSAILLIGKLAVALQPLRGTIDLLSLRYESSTLLVRLRLQRLAQLQAVRKQLEQQALRVQVTQTATNQRQVALELEFKK